MNKFYLSAAAVVAALALPGSPVLAQTSEITIGISISTTGPAAALGIPERNALEFVPKEIGGVPLKVIVLDDGGDPTNATTNARRFVTESKADVIMGSSTTPPSIAVSNVANEAEDLMWGTPGALVAAAAMGWDDLARESAAALASRRDADGLWTQDHYTGGGFPRVFYLRYHGYPEFFPLWAVARYRNLKAGNSRRVGYGL